MIIQRITKDFALAVVERYGKRTVQGNLKFYPLYKICRKKLQEK